jgi:hypothetical protein
MTNSPTAYEKARAAKQKAKAVFADLDSVNGIGLTRRSGRYTVKVLLEGELREIDKQPHNIDGVPVVFQVVGKVRKQPERTVEKKAKRKRPSSRSVAER